MHFQMIVIHGQLAQICFFAELLRLCSAQPSTINIAKTCGIGQDSYCSASQSSVGGDYTADKAVNGIYDDFSHTLWQVSPLWWRLDFEVSRCIGGGKIWLVENCCPAQSNIYNIWVGDSPTYDGTGNTICFTSGNPSVLYNTFAGYTSEFTCNGSGRYFFLEMRAGGLLIIQEVVIYASLYASNAPSSCPSGFIASRQGRSKLHPC